MTTARAVVNSSKKDLPSKLNIGSVSAVLVSFVKNGTMGELNSVKQGKKT